MSQENYAPPWFYDPSGVWVQVGEFARLWHKHPNTIRNWCNSGFINTLGMATWRDMRGAWFIRIPAPQFPHNDLPSAGRVRHLQP